MIPRIETTLLYRHDLLSIPGIESEERPEVQPVASPGLESLRDVGPVNPREVRERLERGDVCYMAHADGGRPTCFAWVQTTGSHHVDPAGFWVRVGTDQAWIYDCYTARWARGRGIYSAVLRTILSGLKESGYQAAFIYTTQSNVVSRRGVAGVGFQPVAQFRSLRIGARAVPLGRAAEGIWTSAGVSYRKPVVS